VISRVAADHQLVAGTADPAAKATGIADPAVESAPERGTSAAGNVGAAEWAAWIFAKASVCDDWAPPRTSSNKIY
jgi:hypothetical protein